MKFTKKLLAFITPLAIAGTIVPTITSCSCGGSGFIINYGDEVNCYDPQKDNYHSLDDVKNAIKVKANKETKSQVANNDLTQFNISLQTDSGVQMCYYDLIASYVVLDGSGITLSGWSVQTFDSTPANYTFTFKGVPYGGDGKNVSAEYVGVETKVYLRFSQTSTNELLFEHQSYMFSDCTFVE